MNKLEKKGGFMPDVKWNPQNGSFTIEFAPGVCLRDYCCAFRDGNGVLRKSTDYDRHICTESSLEDGFGKGRQIILHHSSDGRECMVQQFGIYEEGYLTCMMWVSGNGKVRSSYMAPLYYEGSKSPVEMPGRVRFLSAPFDNDKWAKFVDYPAEYAAPGYEFTVIHEEWTEESEDGMRAGLVAGSIDHDTWKTGIEMGSSFLQIYSGAASEDTRDLNGIGHGFVEAERVSAARIFMEYCPDYRQGLMDFGRLNALVRPKLSWDGPVIFGWNSWAALMGELELDRYKEASDFMKTLGNTYCGEDGRQYINFDAFWDRFSNRMTEAVAYAEENGQVPGTYFCPFITGGDFGQEVSGTDGNYFYEDILLRDHEGRVLPPVDGLYSLDPTHPGTLKHMEYELSKIIKWGFKSIKTDFVGHGCREGAFYNSRITTGVQAYNYGMQHFVDCLKKAPYPVFISLSIAPIFPHGYGHARRISCDAFGSLDQTAYLNNCITYLWWMNDCLYRFNDPDHIVTYKTYDKHSTTLEEGRSRYHAGVICGSLMITSDDYRILEARSRAREVLGNEKVNALARRGESFYPVSGNVGEFAADVFARKEEDGVSAAFFNYSLSEEKKTVTKLAQLGLEQGHRYCWEDLWSTEGGMIEDGYICMVMKPGQSRMIRISRVNQ